jgi:hypothetical protein
MAKKSKKVRAKDVKLAQANDKPESTVATKAVRAAVPVSGSKTAVGAQLAVLAGRPSKPSVVRAFGKTGYALSWVGRAERLGMTPESLCELFKNDPVKVKQLWTSYEETKKQPKAASAASAK